jgi:hypothetical protein
MSRRNLAVATTLAALTAVGGVWFSPAAHADKVKDCGTTTATTNITNPPNASAGFTATTTTTETQTAACNSNSNTGEVITTTTGDTTNKGGGTPNGH